MNNTNVEPSTDKPKTKFTYKSVLSGVIKFIFAAIIIYFAGRQLVSNWGEVSQYHWKINPLLLVISVMLHLATFGIQSKMWNILMNAFGHKVSYKHSFKISYISNLGRYIPGKIWPVFGMIYLLDKININKETAIASWAVATVFGMPASFLAGFITFSLYPEMLKGTFGDNVGIGSIIVVGCIFAFSLILVFAPNKSMDIFNTILKKLKRPTVNFKIQIKVALEVYIGYFIGWVCYGLAFYTFIHAIIENPDVPIIVGIGSFIMAYMIGYLAFFSPGGLGARELVLITVLTPFLGPVVSGIAVAARVWNLICELIAALIALLIKINGKRI